MKIPDAYALKEGIYVRNLQPSFNYSDGDAVENYLAATIKNATDISVGSEELVCAIKDWPSNYHLSPKRADLLRPFSETLKGKKVLEVGCGCGAITRYLGEQGCTVVALEGSNRRARITRERCRDLENVTVVNDNISDFSWHEPFDFVTLIGVLEYSNLYIQATDPFMQLLQLSRSFLTTEGCLVLAIENKLGLKYWAGAPEDHTGTVYFGIENKYNPHTAVTFGRQELKGLLAKAGFMDAAFCYPFPDYKMPDVIITEEGLEQNSINIQNLLVEKFDYMQGIYYTNKFSTSLAATSLHDNGLLADFANSFLVLSHVNKPVQQVKEHNLSFIYSTLRKKPYCKETILQDTVNGVIVKRRYIYNENEQRDNVIKHQISDEAYGSGHLLFNELIPIISQAGWKLNDLKSWAARYYTILKAHAYENDIELGLDGQYLDLTPFNILMQDGNTPVVFDQEWICQEPVPLYYVLFRGLVYSFGRVRYYESPGEAVPLNIIELAVAVIRQFMPFDEAHLTDCKQREELLFAQVSLGNGNPFSHTAIFVRKNFELENESLRSKELNLSKDAEALSFACKQLQEKNEALTTENLTLNTQIREHFQVMTEQWAEVNSKISDLLQLNHVLQFELNQKEADKNLLLAEIKNNIDNLVISYEKNKALMADKMKVEQDLEWYKRTYENRSLLGILKEKITKR